MTATRTPKSPAQRAQEAVDVLGRRITKLTAQMKEATTETKRLSLELDAARKRLEYAKANPDLTTERNTAPVTVSDGPDE